MSRFESATTENSSTNPEDFDDIDDDDDDQTNSSQKIVPNIHKPKTSGEISFSSIFEKKTKY